MSKTRQSWWLAAAMLVLAFISACPAVAGQYPTYEELGLGPCRDISIMTTSQLLLQSDFVKMITINAINPTIMYDTISYVTSPTNPYVSFTPSSVSQLSASAEPSCGNAVSHIFQNAAVLLPCTTTNQMNASLTITPGVHCLYLEKTQVYRNLVFDAQHDSNGRFYIRYTSQLSVLISHNSTFINGAIPNNVVWLIDAGSSVSLQRIQSVVAHGTFLIRTPQNVNLRVFQIEGQVLHSNAALVSTSLIPLNDISVTTEPGRLGSYFPSLPSSSGSSSGDLSSTGSTSPSSSSSTGAYVDSSTSTDLSSTGSDTSSSTADSSTSTDLSSSGLDESFSSTADSSTNSDGSSSGPYEISSSTADSSTSSDLSSTGSGDESSSSSSTAEPFFFFLPLVLLAILRPVLT